MNLILQDKGKKNAVLEETVEKLQIRAVELRHDVERDEAQLDMFGSELWERFVEAVLAPEKIRLAVRRMEIGVDDRDAHLLIEGQYNEVVVLSRKRDQVQEDVENNLRELAVTEGKLAEAKSRLAKNKE